jgi:uncharacterized OB-fold protein
MSAVTPVDTTLFASLDPPRLAGSRCEHCGTVVFPGAPSCPRCCSAELRHVELPERGQLWSWTVQTFRPKAYVLPTDEFEPFAVGYVDLGEVIVEARLVGDWSALRIGLPMRLTLTRAWADETGETVTYAFEPDLEVA